MTTYVNPFTGQTISPSQVAYESLTISQSVALEWPINGTETSDIAANITEITATAYRSDSCNAPCNSSICRPGYYCS